ncbi:LysR family transcriptional regulator [Microbulbifer sp. OS29]|uniref:LysR family transcriptional regulator n=1 Tax=Microbulbifer okhotskensis TaxID=2926617 RepID=A0A9X2J7U9_9GAMM|nr:LysR family transcriptional regulator [Microbulbifer okhotskensis]MCO1336165.1 LysR family transcriptional regulator [Microbulbifer okhotskensis]
MDRFHLITVFNTVAQQGSFTRAARELGSTVSAVSKAIRQLEQQLGTRLIHRTTRSQSLTDAGNDYRVTTERLLSELREVEERLGNTEGQPAGLLRITAPTALGQFWLAPRLPQFTTRFPEIRLELILDDQLRDLTSEGFDLALRSQPTPPHSTLYSDQIGHHKRCLVAAPEYLAKTHSPSSPEQLNGFRLLCYKNSRDPLAWTFHQGQQSVTVVPNAHLSANNYYALYQAALSGVGIACLYNYLVDGEIAAGRLIEVLPDWQQSGRPLFAVYQQRRAASAKLDAFWNFLESAFQRTNSR